jgi:hypothetical protein
MRLLLAGLCALALPVVSLPAALAQGEAPAIAAKPDAGAAEDGAEVPETTDEAGDLQPPLAFEGGTLTVTQPEQYGEKILSYDGRELARGYVVWLQKVVEVGGRKVAIYDVGPGGNACGPAALLIWKPEGGDIETVKVGEDCGAPPAAVTDDRIVFLPYVLPGATALVQTWSPETGLTTAGELSFSPEPGTGWKDLHPSKLQSMIDALRNVAVYRMSRKLLGKNMEEVVTGLSVSGAPETTKMGLIFGNGCTPHACGVADTFMAVDTRNEAVYFAHQGENGIDAWPALKRWPAAIRGLMSNALKPPN